MEGDKTNTLLGIEVILLIVVIILISLIFCVLFVPLFAKLFKKVFTENKQVDISESSKIRLINQLREAVEYLSNTKTGAIITIENNDAIDDLRTDGVNIDANISASLLMSIFNKQSPLHDGAVVIRNAKIIYAATYFKITRKSIDNKYGARHRAAMGISEISDATTIVVSEENGGVTIAKNAVFHPIDLAQFQERIILFLKD